MNTSILTKFTLPLFLLIIISSCLPDNTNIDRKAETNVIGMILLDENNTFNIKDFESELESKWGLDITSGELADSTSLFKINDTQVIIANMDVRIPGNELETSAGYNYRWEDAAEKVLNHKGHIILSVSNDSLDAIQLNVLFSKVASSILNNSKSMAIYLGTRTLVLEKENYIKTTEQKNNLPIRNWIYYGRRKEVGNRSMYTYGLSAFGKPEIEIVRVKKTYDQLDQIIHDAAYFVIKSGENNSMSALESKNLEVELSKGEFLDGMTVKIIYE